MGYISRELSVKIPLTLLLRQMDGPGSSVLEDIRVPRTGLEDRVCHPSPSKFQMSLLAWVCNLNAGMKIALNEWDED